MAVVMVLAGKPDGTPTRFDGQYLEDFDFEARNGQGLITITNMLERAKKFESMDAALKFYQTQSNCKPFRLDMKPNRPLTATNWEIRKID